VCARAVDEPLGDLCVIGGGGRTGQSRDSGGS
jgi:hypothetical protein